MRNADDFGREFLGGPETLENGAEKFTEKPQKVGLVWTVPTSCKGNDRAWTDGEGGNVS